LRRIWQKFMISLARNKRITRFMHRSAYTSNLAGRFTGGPDLSSAVGLTRQLKQEGFNASLYYLGEYVTYPQLVAHNTRAIIATAAALRDAGLDVHISIDPTQVGYTFDEELGCRNATEIAGVVAAGGRTPGSYLMLDMEDHSLVDTTLDLNRDLRAQGFTMAQTLQAYLRRTEADLRTLIESGAPAVRLVKGAFAENSSRAFQNRREIDENYLKLASIMLSGKARAAGFRPVFGTHDEKVARQVIDLARLRGWQPGEYEFEMLYGVRPELRDELRDRGERVRLYLPFGEQWWPYAARRVGENTRNARFVLQALAGSRKAKVSSIMIDLFVGGQTVTIIA